MNRTLNYMARQPKLHQHPLPFGLQYVQICPNQVCGSPVKSPDKITIENQIVKIVLQSNCMFLLLLRPSKPERAFRARRREE